MARPNKGLGHVDQLPGDPQGKRRLRVILSTLSGQLSVAEACDELGIGPTYFAVLRTRVLRGALVALAPLPVGRPPRAAATVTEAEAEALRRQIVDLTRENTILRARMEVAESRVLEIPRSKSASWPPRPDRRPRAAAPQRRAVP